MNYLQAQHIVRSHEIDVELLFEVLFLIARVFEYLNKALKELSNH